jgi:hypothetical protein
MNIKEWITKNKNKSPYLKYAKNYLTQFGDDGIIEQIIKELNVEIEDKLCVEFGAWDGVYLSNVYNLWKNNGFKSILIEGDTSKYNELSNIKNDNIDAHGVFVNIDSNHMNSLDNILKNSKFNVNDDNFILLSVDVDGIDYHIWESLIQYKPMLVVIEIAGGWDVDTEYIGTGASLKSLNILAEIKGYKLVCATGNAYFVREDKLSSLKTYNEKLTITDYYLSDEIVTNVLAKVDENGDLLENYRFKEKSYLEFVDSEKNKLV